MAISIHVHDREGLPPERLEYGLAHQYMGQSNPLVRDILYGLVGQPKRYSELKPLLRGKKDNNLTNALENLLDDGVIDQRVDARRKPATYLYQLTELGKLVVFKMEQFNLIRRMEAL